MKYRKLIDGFSSPMKAIFFVLVLLFNSSCSIFSNEGKGHEYTPLTTFDSKVKLTSVWEQSLKNGQGDLWLHLKPDVDGNFIYAVSYTGIVACFNRLNGKLIWQISSNSPIVGGVSANNNTVAFSTLEGNLVLLDAKTGKEKWKVYVSSEVISPPSLHNNIVAVQSTNGQISVYDYVSQKKIWQHETLLPTLLLRGSAMPVIYKNSIIAGFANGNIYAWNLQTGDKKWVNTVSLPKGNSELERMVDIDATPLVLNNKIYGSTYQGNIKSIDFSTGDTLWTHKISSYNNLSTGFNSLFVSDDKSFITSFDSVSGAINWTQKNLAWRQLSPTQTCKKYLVVGDGQGYLHVLSQANGEIVGRSKIDSSGIRVQPVVIDNIIYTFTNNGILSAFKLEKSNL